MAGGSEILAHIGVPGPAPFVAMGLFTAAMGASYGAYRLFSHRSGPARRAGSIGLGVVAAVCFVTATILPFLLGARPALGRPSTMARLEIVSPAPGEVLHGDPASVAVTLRLAGGKVVPITSLRLVPNEGHIHLCISTDRSSR
jgi:hypothetical protein